MNVRVRLFGAEAAAVGERSIELDIAGDATTAADIKDHLAEAYPGLSGVPTCRIAVNQRFVEDDHKVGADDEVALVGPVSGG